MSENIGKERKNGSKGKGQWDLSGGSIETTYGKISYREGDERSYLEIRAELTRPSVQVTSKGGSFAFLGRKDPLVRLFHEKMTRR